MKLSVIVPAYNEENTIEEIIERVMCVPWAKQVIVIDDGSTDGTREILNHLQEKYPDTIVLCVSPA